jgi:GAF domain-containing protein
MILTPFLPDEAARLRTLDALHVLDTPADPVLDGLVRSAAAALGCPISLVSLVDARRQWIKARIGLELSELPRHKGFCTHAVAHTHGPHALLEVPDATQDARFADNALVTGAAQVRFYAGAPLRVNGHSMGTLCVADTRPRRLDSAQRDLLTDLARATEHCLLSGREHRQLPEAEAYRTACSSSWATA